MSFSFLRLRLSYLGKANIKKYGLQQNFFYSSNLEDEVIEIPKRIPRGPTDILQALESTIGRDPTAPLYKYHDDPFLIPTSNVQKRVFAMAQEAGRKAAHWVRKEHPDLFQHKEACPPIEKFFPLKSYTESSEVDSNDLGSSIKNNQVADAILVYKLLKQKDVEVSRNLEQSLLELLCFYNSDNTLSEDFIEERWFRQGNKGKERQRKTWKDGDFAEELFIGIKEPDAKTYSALIQGMVKYFQVKRAWELFEEARQKGLELNTDTFNSIISATNFIKEDNDMRWAFIMNLLTDMKTAKIKPNLGTLNAILQSLSTMGNSRIIKESALKTLAEFKNIDIEPSLATWYFLLITFCKERGPTSYILRDIVNEIENKEHKIRDLRDVNFFVTAMDICRYHLNDLELAIRVNNLLLHGNNYDLIGDSYKESIYYRHYFILRCSWDSIDEFMNDTYYKLVPHLYVPEPGVMGEVLAHIEASGAIEYLPQLWSDMITFDHTNRESLVEFTMNIMSNNIPKKDSDLVENFSNIAWDIYRKLFGQQEDRPTNKITITGDLLGKIMLLLLRNNEFEKASEVLLKLDKEHHKIAGVPNLDALSLYIDSCIENKSPSAAILALQYCADIGYAETEQLAIKVNKELTLDEVDSKSIEKIIGHAFVNNESVT